MHAFHCFVIGYDSLLASSNSSKPPAMPHTVQNSLLELVCQTLLPLHLSGLWGCFVARSLISSSQRPTAPAPAEPLKQHLEMQQLQAHGGLRQQGVANRQVGQLPGRTAAPMFARPGPLRPAQWDSRPQLQQQAAAALLAPTPQQQQPQHPQQQRQAVRCAAAAGAGAAAAGSPAPTASWKVPAYILLW